MEKAPNIDALAEDSNIEKIEEKKSLLELLNKARQEHKEQEIYNFVFSKHTSSNNLDLPDYLRERSDLIDKFAVGFGKPYTSSSTAAHDLIEYLASEVEDTIHDSEDDIEKQRIKKEKVRIKGEIDSKKRVLEKFNKARQDQAEAESLYNYIFGIDTSNPYDLPKYLIAQDDIVANFSYGNAGQKYNSKATAAHDLVEFLYEKSEKQIKDLENELVDLSPELRKEKEEEINATGNIVSPPPVETIEVSEPEIEPEPAVSDVVEEEPVEGVNEDVAIPTIPVNTPTEEVVGSESTSTEANVNNLEKKGGIFKRIDQLTRKYPKLSRFLVALELTTILSSYAGHDNRTPSEEIVSTDTQKELESKVSKTLISLMNKKPKVDIEGTTVLPEGYKNDVIVEGFENFVLSNEQIEKIVEDTMPKGFTFNISRIEYVDKEPEMPDSYGLNKTRNTEGVNNTSAATAFTSKGRIEIYKNTNNSKIWIANQLLGHEVFHFQDWRNSPFLSPNERLELLSSVLKRLESPDRFKSFYVEDIDNVDEKVELALKADEYFAEIGGTYLSPSFDLLPDADKQLVHNYILKIDPDFKRGDALKKRDEIIGYHINDGTDDKRTEDQRENDWKNEAEMEWYEVLKLLNSRGRLLDPNEEQTIMEKDRYISRVLSDKRTFYKSSIARVKADYQTRLKNRYNNYEK